MQKKLISALVCCKSAGLKIQMLIVIVCMYSGLFAQDSGSINNDHYQEYMKKNSTSPLVKLYTYNPEIARAYQAMRYAVILDKPGNYGDFSQEDLENMRNELKSLMVAIENIDAISLKGESYERAETIHSRQMVSKHAMDEKTRGNQSRVNTISVEDAPSLSVPK